MGAVTSPTRTVPVAILAACMVTVGSGSPRVAAQAASPSALKAAFLFNFAKFAEWPALPADAPVRVCVAGDALVATALVDTLRGQSIETHGLQAIQLASDGSARGCQVLFLSAGEAGRAATLLSDATASPVLTVSDAEKFAQSGGMVELFVEGGRMKFAINVDAVQRSRIRLSSRLLGLARIVRDQHGS